MLQSQAVVPSRGEARKLLDQLFHDGFRPETLGGTKARVTLALKAHAAGNTPELGAAAEKLAAYAEHYGIKSLRAAAPHFTDKAQQPWHRLRANEDRRVAAIDGRAHERNVGALLSSAENEMKAASTADSAARKAKAHVHYSAAIRILTRAVKAGDASGRAHAMLGEAHFNQGAFAKAVEHFEKALTFVQHDHNGVRRDLAVSHARIGFDEEAPERAIPHLQTATSIWPGMAEAHTREGWLHTRLADQAGATNPPDYARRRELEDQGLYAFEAGVHARAAGADLDGLNHARRVKLSETPAERDARRADTLAWYAWALEHSARGNRLSAAIEAAERALELNPTNSSAFGTLQRVTTRFNDNLSSTVAIWRRLEGLIGDVPAPKDRAVFRTLLAQVAIERGDLHEATYHADMARNLDQEIGEQKLAHIARVREFQTDTHDRYRGHVLSGARDGAHNAVMAGRYGATAADRLVLEAARDALENRLIEAENPQDREALIEVTLLLRDFAGAEALAKQAEALGQYVNIKATHVRDRHEADVAHVDMLAQSITAAYERNEIELAGIRLDALTKLDPKRAAAVLATFPGQRWTTKV